MATLIQLLLNSDPAGVFTLVLTLGLSLFTAIYFVLKGIKIGNLYLFDGGDASVPSIISYILIFLTIFVVNFFSWSKGSTVPEAALVIYCSFITMISMMLRGRIFGFPTVNITSNKKQVMLFTTCILSITSLIAGVTLYDSNQIVHLQGLTFNCISMIMYDSLAVTLTPGILMPIVLAISTYIIEGMIFYFDIKERRGSDVILRDTMLPIATTIYLVFGVFQEQLMFLIGTPVVPVLYLFIIAVMLAHIGFEANGIIHRASKVNTVIKSVQKLIDKIVRKKSYTKNDKFRFDQILSVIKSDNEVRESVLSQNYFSINSRRRHFIARLNQAYEHPELVRVCENYYSGPDRRSK